MTKRRNELGLAGEEAAIAHLQANGYQILHRNFRNRYGEIDLIAKDGDALCFIEVKTRLTDSYGSPFESVTKAKQRKIIYVAMSYLTASDSCEVNARFDVVAVTVDAEGGPVVEVIKNAFEAN